MRKKIKKAIVIVICIIGLGIVATVAFFHTAPGKKLSARGFMSVMRIYVKQLRVKLLYKTDHKALLAACRELSKKVTDGNIPNGPYRLRSGPDRKILEIPRPILNLKPNDVYINYNGRVIVEMLGGLDHFGVYAYPVDYEKPAHASEELGHKKLLDGLWYYDDGYQHCASVEEYEEYDRYIESLKPKGK
jgi:hypothetical protein